MKTSRRTFLQAASATCAAAALLPKELAAAATHGAADDPLQWVDLRIGTGGHGHCYPGASVPFGAVQLSPDTYNRGWDWCSGYHLSDSSLMGFSHTHLSGTGASDCLDFLVMAGTGTAKLKPGPRDNPSLGYRSRFDHSSEVLEPSYYAVTLKDYGVRAEMTATERTGLHRYTFPKSDQAYLILDLSHAYDDRVSPTTLEQLGPATFAGGHITTGWAIKRHAYFTMEVSRTPDRIVFYSDDVEVPAGKLRGTNLKAVMYFKTRAEEAILVKTGISAVSPEGGAGNLAAEAPQWDFEGVREAARKKWKAQLSKIAVTSANRDHKRIFYTGLYHMSLGPTRFDDADGKYRGMDGKVHQLAAGQQNYTTFSLWDTYRAAHPVYTLIEPERVPQFVNSLLRMAEESPAGMPVWPLQGTETGCMTGYHSAAVISEAINKGFAGIDAERAYKLMMKRAMVDDYRGLPYYRKLGYIPADREEESVSKTFEYCYDDWAIANVAAKLGKTADATMLAKRSTNYRNYFNPAIAFMQPKLEDGSWALPFTPISLGHTKKWRDFTESNSWQTTFGVQHDVAGLIALFGGRAQFIEKLDGLFSAPSDLPPDAPPDIAGLVGQYAHGNEPSHHIAFMYVYAGAPHKTQARIRSLLETMYAAQPDGLQGNEDVGQMSAWYVLSSLGFYSVDPVSGVYVVGTPLFESAVVQLGGGRTLNITVKRTHSSDAYVHKFTLNGKPQDKLWFRHSDIAQGGSLTFEMGSRPSATLGLDPSVAPPSLSLA